MEASLQKLLDLCKEKGLKVFYLESSHFVFKNSDNINETLACTEPHQKIIYLKKELKDQGLMHLMILAHEISHNLLYQEKKGQYQAVASYYRDFMQMMRKIDSFTLEQQCLEQILRGEKLLESYILEELECDAFAFNFLLSENLVKESERKDFCREKDLFKERCYILPYLNEIKVRHQNFNS